jgi:hypothetical protein
MNRRPMSQASVIRSIPSGLQLAVLAALLAVVVHPAPAAAQQGSATVLPRLARALRRTPRHSACHPPAPRPHKGDDNGWELRCQGIAHEFRIASNVERISPFGSMHRVRNVSRNPSHELFRFISMACMLAGCGRPSRSGARCPIRARRCRSSRSLHRQDRWCRQPRSHRSS